MSNRPTKPPVWAERIVQWVLGIASSRARKNTLQRFLVARTPTADLLLCAWLPTHDGFELVVCFRPSADFLARLYTDSANSDWNNRSLAHNACDAVVICQVSSKGLQYTRHGAKREAARELLDLPRLVFNPAEMVRLICPANAVTACEMSGATAL